GGDFCLPSRCEELFANSQRERQFPAAQAVERGKYDAAHHHFQRFAAARTAPLFPASRKSANDLKDGRTRAAGAHDELERKGNGTAHSETAEAWSYCGLCIRPVDGKAVARERPSGMGQFRRAGRDPHADVARKRKRATGFVARGARAAWPER